MDLDNGLKKCEASYGEGNCTFNQYDGDWVKQSSLSSEPKKGKSWLSPRKIIIALLLILFIVGIVLIAVMDSGSIGFGIGIGLCMLSVIVLGGMIISWLQK